MKKGYVIFLSLLVLACIGTASAEVTPMRDDGQLKYTNLATATGTYGMRPAGHAVYFTNKDPIVITGVKMYGCKYGDTTGNVRFEIWDENLKTLFSDTVPYDKVPFRTAATQGEIKNALDWQSMTLPDHLVSGNFYYVVFTDSAPFGSGHGMRIGFTHPTAAFTSHAVGSGPNAINEKTINVNTGSFTTDKVDWMIRPLYKDAPVTTATSAAPATTVTTQPAAAETTAEAAQAATALATTAAAAPTKAPVETGVLVAGVLIGLLAIRRER